MIDHVKSRQGFPELFLLHRLLRNTRMGMLHNTRSGMLRNTKSGMLRNTRSGMLRNTQSAFENKSKVLQP